MSINIGKGDGLREQVLRACGMKGSSLMPRLSHSRARSGLSSFSGLAGLGYRLAARAEVFPSGQVVVPQSFNVLRCVGDASRHGGRSVCVCRSGASQNRDRASETDHARSPVRETRKFCSLFVDLCVSGKLVVFFDDQLTSSGHLMLPGA